MRTSSRDQCSATGKTLLAVLMLAMTAELLAKPAAGETAPAQGTISAVSVPSSVRTADGNTFVTTRDTGAFTGTFTGTFEAQTEAVFHASGRAEFHGTVVFQGTVEGCGPRTVIFLQEGTGMGAVFEGKLVSIQDATSHVQAVLSFIQVGPMVTYQGQYHCSP